MNAIKVERITPEPEQAKATEHGIEYAIAVAGPGQRMRRARVDEADVMEAARRLHGIERWDQIKYAVLEVSGGINVIPNERAQGMG